MRELEFLPDWYPQMRRRKRMAFFQASILALTLAGCGLWIGLSQHNLHASAATLQTLQQDLDRTRAEQTILGRKLQLRKELQDREQLIASLGVPVEMTRLLQTLDSVMPPQMSLLKFDSNIEEQTHTVTSVAGVRPGDKPQQQIDRRLKVKLNGVTPNDVDLANFLAGLTKVTFFDQVAVSYARNKVEANHVMREFEITFVMSLDQPAGN